MENDKIRSRQNSYWEVYQKKFHMPKLYLTFFFNYADTITDILMTLNYYA